MIEQLGEHRNLLEKKGLIVSLSQSPYSTLFNDIELGTKLEVSLQIDHDASYRAFWPSSK